MLIWLTPLLLLFAAGLASAAPPAQRAHPDWVGAKRCANCHAAEYAAWRESHHDLAMQAANATTVLGNFDNARFDYAGISSRFFRRNGAFWVNTDGPAGALRDYRVEYVFGYHPLQQYLLSLPGGRLQALSIAWDSRSAGQGGQRWFHLYPGQAINAADPLHWSGSYHNWNGRCAECHSTHLEKNFDARSGEFATTWTELNVACEACHGPGQRHVALAAKGALQGQPGAGFAVDLGDRNRWVFRAGQAIAQRRTAVVLPPVHTAGQPLQPPRQIAACARCHSRREPLGTYRYGRELLDTHRLSLLEAPFYYSDGQIRDEVYVVGSFLQSKMARAGVVCSNCHEPHSLQLRAPGNAVCSQCHRSDVYAQASHHHHRDDSAGAQCVNCHMPATTYMAVDPRRDHSLRVPRPDLSVVSGLPNACTQCHSSETAEWALQASRAWGIRYTDTATHPARVLAQARQGDGRSLPALSALALNPAAAAIVRATAAAELGTFTTRANRVTARSLLNSADALLRAGAVRALAGLPPAQQFAALAPHLQDPSATVRMTIAGQLAAVPLQQLAPPAAQALQRLFTEYLQTRSQHADLPETQIQLGLFFTARQRWQSAEAAYRQALQLAPGQLAALLNLADLYRLRERDEEARPLLQQAAASAPLQGAPHHALGLLETRAGNREAALRHLQTAAQLEQTGIRHRYVYAIALHDTGATGAAIDQLRLLLRSAPEQPELLFALADYCRAAGRLDEARHYADRLRQLLPDDAAVRRLYDSL